MASHAHTTRRSIFALASVPLVAGIAPRAFGTPAVADDFQLLLRYEQWLYREHYRVAEACDRDAINLIPGGFDPAIGRHFDRNMDKPYRADAAAARRVLSAAGVSVAPDPDFASKGLRYVRPRSA